MNQALRRSTFPVTEECIGDVVDFEHTQPWIYGIDNPYLHGAYAPTTLELSESGLSIEGEIPTDLVGTYFRNGPNPIHQPGNRYHPFDGDGMVHAVSFCEGAASYRNRYIDTVALTAERAMGQSTSNGVMGPFDFETSEFGIKDTSNTDLFYYAGSLMTLWYNAGHPYRLDPHTLETTGYFELEGRPQRRLSAHSKVDWTTGELLFFDYGDEPPYMTYGVADPSGKLRHEVAIDLPGPRLPHDIGFTPNYTILHDLPFFHDPKVLQRHQLRVLTFHRDIPTRFGLIPRHGRGEDWRSNHRWPFDQDVEVQTQCRRPRRYH